MAQETVMTRLMLGLCFATLVAGVQAQELSDNVYECTVLGVSG